MNYIRLIYGTVNGKKNILSYFKNKYNIENH